MTEIKLPTKEDLEVLYAEKGRDALVWYAWRNALRALPLLGERRIEDVWKDDGNVVRHVVSVCRVSLVLAQWKTQSINHASDTALAAYAPSAAALAASAYYDVAPSAVASAAAAFAAFVDGDAAFTFAYATFTYPLRLPLRLRRRRLPFIDSIKWMDSRRVD